LPGIQRHGWDSPHTQVRMELVRHGEQGAPLVYIPSSGGNQDEFESYGMADVCAPWIRSGKLQLFSIDGRGPHTLFDPELSPPQRIDAYARLERYVADELLDWIEARTGANTVGIVGASYGAFVGANLLFKHPRRIELLCGLGGVYEMWHRLDGYSDDTVYFHTPLAYLPTLSDATILDAIRATRGLWLYAAECDEWLAETRQLEQLLQDKQLPHGTYVWPAPADHHERWWKRQFADFLTRAYGPA
jgi:esterase/lipase superfamily enzyme